MGDPDDGSNGDSPRRARARSPGSGARPLVFDLARAGMRRKLEALALAGSVLSVVDPLPQRDAYGRWILFPWSGRLVHVLPPDELRAARARGRSVGRRRIGVAGLGRGGWIALALLRQGVDCAFRLADMGVVRPGDLRQMPVGVHDVGTPKTEAVARAMYEIDPFVEIECFGDVLELHEVDAFLVDGGGTDMLLLGSIGSRALLAQRARDLEVPVVHATDRVDVDIDVLRLILEDLPPPGSRRT